ncbi:MAG: alpha/beta fold hydrolase [Prochlorotrichaceae cyanobacterium]|jgi:pimeloyl-ACP methyl ester carboxylesterase
MTLPTDNIQQAGKFQWFYRESTPVCEMRSTVVLLHGIVSQSYSWRSILPALAEQGFRTIAPDWLGTGYSDKPELFEFAYTPDAFGEAFGQFVDALELESFHLVAQGFLGSVGIQYALRNPQRIDRLAILNAPITQDCSLPWRLKQMALPLAGEMMTQDPLLVDRTLEGGGGYRVADEDLDVYRRPFLKSSDAGRSLLATLRRLQLPKITAEIEKGLQEWNRSEKPLLFAWGDRDPWLSLETIQPFVQNLKGAELKILQEVGHYPQEDWAEKVSEVLLTFLRQSI